MYWFLKYISFLYESEFIMESLNLKSVQQTLSVINGKWKIPIIAALRIHQRCRFKDFLTHIEGLGSKMLSKELKELESQGILKRIVEDNEQLLITYELSLYGKTLDNIILALSHWGDLHIKRMENHNPDHPIEHFNTISI